MLNIFNNNFHSRSRFEIPRKSYVGWIFGYFTFRKMFELTLVKIFAQNDHCQAGNLQPENSRNWPYRWSYFDHRCLKSGVSTRWSFGPNFAWCRIETMIIGKTHPTLLDLIFLHWIIVDAWIVVLYLWLYRSGTMVYYL